MKRSILFVLLLVLIQQSLKSQEILVTEFPPQEETVSPVIEGNTLILRISGSYASEIKVEGSWLDEPQLMKKGTDGIWYMREDGMTKGLYTYRFIVDGIPTIDDANPSALEDNGILYSFFYIEGSGQDLYYEPERRGNIQHIWFDGTTKSSSCNVTVYLPYGYDKDKTKSYPVLYLLHGAGSDESSWSAIGRAGVILDNMIQQGLCKEMIVVMPDCTPSDGSEISSSGISALMADLIPFVQSRYRTYAVKEQRGVAAIDECADMLIPYLTLHPEMFAYISIMGCNVSEDRINVDDFLRVKKDEVRLLWIGCGSNDADALTGSRKLHEMLNYIHLDHSFYVNSGNHDWATWRRHLSVFLPLFFKYHTD